MNSTLRKTARFVGANSFARALLQFVALNPGYSGAQVSVCMLGMLRLPAMRKFALRHRQVVRLMMRAAHEDPDEAQAADALDFLRIAGRDGEQDPLVERRRFRAPTVEPVDLSGVRRNHALDRGERASGAGDGDLQPAVDWFGCDMSLQRHVVHVDEVLAQ